MRRHDFDALSFGFGLLFAAAGLALLAGARFQPGMLTPWAGPLVLIGLAIVIVIAARPRTAHDDDTTDSEPAG